MIKKRSGLKRVLMIGPSPSAHGGIATVIGTLLRHGYTNTGECEFIATHKEGGVLLKARVAAVAWIYFFWLLISGQVLLLHAHAASGVSFWRKAMFIGTAHLFRCPVVFHLHSGEFQIFFEQRLSGYRRKIARELIRRSVCGFVLSRDAGDFLRDNVGLKRIELIPNPIFIKSIPESFERSHDVLFLGRLEEKKGVFDLLRSFSRVYARLPTSRLVLAGDGGVSEIQALAIELGIIDAVVFLGWIGEEKRTKWLARAGVFVLPSHYEQMPMTVLEAMAAGTPIIATRVGAVIEMLDYGNCGCIVEVGDIEGQGEAILLMLNNKAMAKTASEQAFARVNSIYSVDIVLDKLRYQYKILSS